MNSLVRITLFYCCIILPCSNVAHAGLLDDIKGMVLSNDEFSLCQAIRKNQTNRIESLTKQNPNLINTDETPTGCNLPLHEMARLGSSDAYKLVRHSVVNLDKKDASGNTPLHVAVTRPLDLLGPAYVSEAIELVQFFIKDGADVNAKDSLGRTPLTRAIRAGNDDIVAILEKNGATQDKHPAVAADNALHKAAKSGEFAKVKYLIDQGADVNGNINANDIEKLYVLPPINALRKYNKVTPLHVSSDAKVSQLLIDNGANVDAELVGVNLGYIDGSTPLHFASNSEIVSTLVGAGANVNATTGDGDTPLHKAAFYRKTSVVKGLLLDGADASIRNSRGEIPADIARKKKYSEILDVLEK